jgi:hypothetical protein
LLRLKESGRTDNPVKQYPSPSVGVASANRSAPGIAKKQPVPTKTPQVETMLAETSPTITAPLYLTPQQVAELWALDPASIRRIFRDEPGVLKFGNGKSTYKKQAHTTIRIPPEVLERVRRRMTNGAN